MLAHKIALSRDTLRSFPLHKLKECQFRLHDNGLSIEASPKYHPVFTNPGKALGLLVDKR